MLSITVPAEEEGVLQHDAQLAAQVVLFDAADVVPVDQDLAASMS